ncbi:MAG: MarR family transcriptional regulator [Rhodanobacter sp.]|nr:MAG: MarR family transcriptional regulator [Rhodanobacter sp.]
MKSKHSPSPGGSIAEDSSALCLERQLCFALYAASNQVTRLARPMLDQLGLTYPQYLVMLVLWQHTSCTVGEIGSRLMLDSGTLTPLLKRMQGNGLITRTRDMPDERCVRIALSAQGRALKHRAGDVPGQMRCRIALPDASLESLREQLHGLLSAIQPTVDVPGAKPRA